MDREYRKEKQGKQNKGNMEDDYRKGQGKREEMMKEHIYRSTLSCRGAWHS